MKAQLPFVYSAFNVNRGAFMLHEASGAMIRRPTIWSKPASFPGVASYTSVINTGLVVPILLGNDPCDSMPWLDVSLSIKAPNAYARIPFPDQYDVIMFLLRDAMKTTFGVGYWNPQPWDSVEKNPDPISVSTGKTLTLV